MDDRVFLTYEEAVAMLPPGSDYIHTFRSRIPGIFVGAQIERGGILNKLRDLKPELAGEVATNMGHGLVVIDDHGPLFIETIKTEA